MRKPICLMVLVALGAAPVAGIAQQAPAQAKEQPKQVTNPTPSVEDVATTPLSDINVKKGEIPAVLQRAQAQPYGTAGLASCARITHEIRSLTAVLGADADVAAAKGKPVKVGVVAQSVVGGLIPFRGVVREISGANAEQRRLQSAIYAGFARRGFLKGLGQQRGCRVRGL